MNYRPDVVAGRFDPSMFDPTGKTLLVNEMFYTIQGEGTNAGRAAVFVRLAKCNLACKFCDTEFNTFTPMAVMDVVDRVKALSPEPPQVGGASAQMGWQPLVVLTGGEPGLQNCGPLVKLLQGAGWMCCLETSGSVYSEWMDELYHICVSPKVKLPDIPAPLMAACNEVKWVVNDAFLTMYERNPNDCYALGPTNYLQPESQNPKWAAAAVKLVQSRPYRYRLSIQTHKYIGAP